MVDARKLDSYEPDFDAEEAVTAKAELADVKREFDAKWPKIQQLWVHKTCLERKVAKLSKKKVIAKDGIDELKVVQKIDLEIDAKLKLLKQLQSEVDGLKQRKHVVETKRWQGLCGSWGKTHPRYRATEMRVSSFGLAKKKEILGLEGVFPAFATLDDTVDDPKSDLVVNFDIILGFFGPVLLKLFHFGTLYNMFRTVFFTLSIFIVVAADWQKHCTLDRIQSFEHLRGVELTHFLLFRAIVITLQIIVGVIVSRRCRNQEILLRDGHFFEKTLHRVTTKAEKAKPGVHQPSLQLDAGLKNIHLILKYGLKMLLVRDEHQSSWANYLHVFLQLWEIALDVVSMALLAKTMKVGNVDWNSSFEECEASRSMQMLVAITIWAIFTFSFRLFFVVKWLAGFLNRTTTSFGSLFLRQLETIDDRYFFGANIAQSVFVSLFTLGYKVRIQEAISKVESQDAREEIPRRLQFLETRRKDMFERVETLEAEMQMLARQQAATQRRSTTKTLSTSSADSATREISKPSDFVQFYDAQGVSQTELRRSASTHNQLHIPTHHPSHHFMQTLDEMHDTLRSSRARFATHPLDSLDQPYQSSNV
eukprot:m.86897 g.86897  ORF g.86897 m.86897 type:complete len:592 (+) comp26014_c0_seq1:192-1967(+)